jgi:hypothetical protein
MQYPTQLIQDFKLLPVVKTNNLKIHMLYLEV